MRILVTGAGGMLAKDVVDVLTPIHEIVALDRSSLDIADPAAVERTLQASRPELVVNCAAFPDVDGCEREPARAFAANGSGPGNLARYCEKIGARLFHVSTDYVFDGRKGSAYHEGDATNPINRYGHSKLEGEKQVLGGGKGDRHLILRTSWLFGVHKANFVEKILEGAKTRDRLEAVADQTSCPTWTYHAAQRIAALAETPAAGVLHLAGSGGCTRQEMAAYIAKKVNPAIEVAGITWAQLKVPAQRPLFSVIVSRRFEEFGIPPLPDWKEAVDDYLSVAHAAMFALKGV